MGGLVTLDCLITVEDGLLVLIKIFVKFCGGYIRRTVQFPEWGEYEDKAAIGATPLGYEN